MEVVLIAIGSMVASLLLLVLLHEFAHFATARAFGVKVLEFGIGFPPRIGGIYTGKTRVIFDDSTQFVNMDGVAGLNPGARVKVRSTQDAHGNLVARVVEASSPARRRILPGNSRRGRPGTNEQPEQADYLKHEGKVRAVGSDHFILADMLYSVNLLPIGGFVRMAGDTNPAVPGSLAGKGVGARLLVLAAGPMMNAIIPIVIFAALFMIPRPITVGQVVVEQVTAGSPAAAAGLQPGDIVARADGLRIETAEHLTNSLNGSSGSDMEWSMLRSGKENVVRLKPQLDPSDDSWSVGISTKESSYVEKRSVAPWTAVGGGLEVTWNMMVVVEDHISSAITQGDAPELAGPIGIAQVTGEATQQLGLVGWLLITAFLSLNLAIMNVLPIPMMDGAGWRLSSWNGCGGASG